MFDPIEIQSHKGLYKAFFDDNGLAQLNDSVPENAHFIIDKKVADLYRDKMVNILAHPSVLLIEALEQNKSLDCFPAYVDHLVSQKLRRDHVLIAIGGGIIQDITCFLSATMLRGVDWYFYPTTLLSQADSCIGSKSSINSGMAKNILGTFTPPKKVTISTHFLDTLDLREIHSGVGEMIKVHVIDGPNSFDHLAANFDAIFSNKSVMMDFIRRSLLIKKSYIEKDEFDENIRNVFNYGHSFGHAIEAATQFGIPHGIAVSIGADMANFISWKLGVGRQDHYQRMHSVLSKNYAGFDKTIVPLDAFLAAISKDKKNVGADLTLILADEKAKVFKASYSNNQKFVELCKEYLENIR